MDNHKKVHWKNDVTEFARKLDGKYAKQKQFLRSLSVSGRLELAKVKKATSLIPEGLRL